MLKWINKVLRRFLERNVEMNGIKIKRFLSGCFAVFCAVLSPLCSALAENNGTAALQSNSGQIAESKTNLKVWDGTVATQYAGGNGTEEQPFLISNGSELALLMREINSATKESEQTTENLHYRLTADILLNDVSNFSLWETQPPQNKWTPGGIVSNYFMKGFAGTLDGGNFSVIGLYVNSESPYSGLFGCVYNGCVKNLKIQNAYVEGTLYSAGLAGYVKAQKKNAEIAGCTAENSKIYGTNNVGGICGYAEALQKCVYFERCENSGGQVTAKNNFAGGIVGSAAAYGIKYSNDGNYAVEIKNCANSSAVCGNVGVGGIFGSSKDFVSEISGKVKIAMLVKNCLNTGNILSLSQSEHSGGIAGTVGTAEKGDENVVSDFECCYTLKCDENAKIYGFSSSSTDLKDCAVYSSEQMTVAENFKNFDFEKTWNIIGGGTAPTLRKLGDFSGDGNVSAKDVISSVEYFIGQNREENNFEIVNADFNGDGKITLFDINALMRYFRGKGATGA